MAQYHLRVADDELHVRFPGGEERSIPLEDALTSNMLRNIVADRATDREVGIRFQPGVLETWLRCVAVERPEIITSLATDTLMEYIKVRCRMCALLACRFNSKDIYTGIYTLNQL